MNNTYGNYITIADRATEEMSSEVKEMLKDNFETTMGILKLNSKEIKYIFKPAIKYDWLPFDADLSMYSEEELMEIPGLYPTAGWKCETSDLSSDI